MARHLAILDRELTDIETGRNKRLIVQMPPRHGKSLLTSCYFPAHYLGMNPERNVILTSATDDLAVDFSGMARDVVTDWGHLFGISLRKDRGSLQHWELDQGGGLRAAGVGSGSIMGRGADLLLIDDYFRNIEAALSEGQRAKLYQWFLSTSGTRLAPGAAIVLVCTRWHAKDLAGCALKNAEETGEKWRVLSLPALGDDGAALWPEQWSAEAMQTKRKEYYASGYPWMWEALYQQNPPEVLDAAWPAEYFEDVLFDEWPPESEVLWKVLAVDPSLGGSEKSDYSAIVMLSLATDGLIYVDADIDRRDVVRLVDAALSHYRLFCPQTMAVETDGFNAIVELLIERNKGLMPPLAKVKQHHDKISRVHLGLTAYLAHRRFRFRDKSPGSRLLLEQLRGFPAHKFKDGPDALETGLRTIRELEAGGMPDNNRLSQQVYA